ncbi:hypothetical protein [Natranaeroarchaeum aerophilus]|uniref:Right handed beta helix domain-containing protein n=1 Tax=Natranaeroarchaeum aerophilus TaxID=2917711 RepID=A0AAE3K599_9EURY|nr:hypothetical protein [Natranaeroarchaeum aerophilus]MCL9813806.1 hypothetical protein [Natranaeroarchaeum aerophilus]
MLADDYRTITVDSGATRVIRVNSDETLENLLVDISADGADARIVAQGNNWTIRNVGFHGVASQSSLSNCIAASGTGTIERCYFGDGIPLDASWSKGCIGVSHTHSGEINVHDTYISGWEDNAVYAAGAARDTDGGGGTINFYNCYFRDNNISHLRVATDGTVIEDCVFHNDSEVRQGGSSAINSRGIYTGYGDPSQTVTVRNCDVDIGSHNTNGAGSAFVSGTHDIQGPLTTIRVQDSEVRGETHGEYVEYDNVGSDPTIRVPEGVPTDAETAATGRPEDTTEEEEPAENLPEMEPHLLTFISTDDDDRMEYQFMADGPVEALTESPYMSPSGNDIRATSNFQIDQEDDDYVIQGHTGNGYGDAFEVYGSVTEATVDSDEMIIELDGDRINEAELVKRTGDQNVSESEDDDERESTTERSADTDDGNENITSDSGDDTEQRSSTSTGANEGDLPNDLIIDGSDNGTVSQYEVSVSGEIVPDEELSSVVNQGLAWDTLPSTISDGTVVGVVGHGKDGYRYSGNIISVEIRGDAGLDIERS